MEELTYAVMLAFVVVVTLPLEILLRTRVYARLRRLGLVLLCVGLPFAVWDVAAVRAGHWSFDESLTLGVGLAGLPLEEILFFIVVPLASVMTLEAVRSVRGRAWPVGDELPREEP
ncbi:lycopene cyclase domain-containing protein [Knoellia sp. CPCC 206435]|uniref:lycopene cyclase domain-containing protein n=1 Tax=Knoellia terrae TaxID=3404797 RepID=UPI003B439D7C